MKIGKKRNTSALSGVWVSALLMAGCSTEWLDIKPKGRFTEGDLPDGSLEGRVFAAYSGLRSEATSGLPYAAVHNIRSDDAHLGSNSGDYSSDRKSVVSGQGVSVRVGLGGRRAIKKKNN